jgi:xanthine/CO dehydrogenase XdhC/CoxF family maturation factor
MSERGELIGAMEQAAKMGKRAAIASVVRVTGSAYRREGTKMLIDEDGAMTCMISGGCLEPEIAEMAKTIIREGGLALRHFNLDEDVLWGLGIGCGGSIDVYIEPMKTEPLMNLWTTAVKEEHAAALATIIEASAGAGIAIGTRMFVPEAGKPAGTLGHETLDHAVIEAAHQKFQQLYPRSETRRFNLVGDQTADVFIDVSVPSPELVIFGAGHDAMPLAAFGVKQGYKVSVVDARPAFATSGRFPGANVIVAHPAEFQDKVTLGPRSYVVIMNHYLERDSASLRLALESVAPYVGVLGPRSRYAKLLSDLRNDGVEPTKAQLARVHNPVGLDVGADSPEEVALSILGEILAVRNNHAAGFLRNREGGIHKPSAAINHVRPTPTIGG